MTIHNNDLVRVDNMYFPKMIYKTINSGDLHNSK